MKIEEIKQNPNNPRIIRDDKFKRLCKSIEEFPKMMELRPMVVNSDMIVLGGNMRLRALKELGFSEIPDNWVKRADELTDDEIRRFIILDNSSFGEWEFDLLMSDWSREELEDWGVDLPEFDQTDYSDKNKEIDVSEFGDEMEIKLKYPENIFHDVRNKFAEIADTPEKAVLILLNYEQPFV